MATALDLVFAEAATDGIKLLDAALKALALYQGETRSVDYVTIQAEKAAFSW